MKKLLILLLAALAFSACSEKEYERQWVSDQTIRFSATLAEDWNTMTRSVMEQNAKAKVQKLTDGLYLHTVVSPGFESNRQQEEKVTRGTPYTNSTFSEGETFYVSGYCYASTPGSANFLASSPVSYDNGEWKTSANFYMPGSNDKIDFFAWFVPTGTGGITVNNAEGGTKLTYEVPEAVSAQPDLLAAVKTGQSYSTSAVELSFAHQLTCVNFEIDDNVAPGTITEIAFLGIYKSAELTIGGGWNTSQGTTADLEYSLNYSTTGTDGYVKTGNDRKVLSNLMMIPQTFNGEQKIRVRMTVGTTQKVLTALLAGDDLNNPLSWQPGTTVTYKISTSSINTLVMDGVTYPTLWDELDVSSLLKSDFTGSDTNGDAIGIYGVDSTGNVVLDNLKYEKKSSGAWETSSAQPLFVPSYRYFAYYPYSTSGLAHSGKKNNVVVTTAVDFFAGGIDAWTVAEDQRDANVLKAQDLQVGNASLTSASTIRFIMQHAMGLVKITRQEREAHPRITYSGSGDSYTKTFNNKLFPYRVSNIGLAEKMYPTNDELVYYYIVKGGSDNTFSSSATGDDRWKNSLTKTVGIGESYAATAEFAVSPETVDYVGYYYSYTGSAQTFSAAKGIYKISCWGAQGSTGSGAAGKGGYTDGTIRLSKDTTFYVYVGQCPGNNNMTGGWNGGGNGNTSKTQTGYGGGGATDIRLKYNQNWNDVESLMSRIMVAAGGGGGGGAFSTNGSGIGGAGGGIEGVNGSDPTNWGETGPHFCGLKGTQTEGGNLGDGASSPGTDQTANEQIIELGLNKGGFGYGGSDGGVQYSKYGGAGGGGGWYGGGASDRAHGGGGGGSSYVSGLTGCKAISSTATTENITHSESSVHPSGLQFESASTIAGNASQPTPGSSNTTQTGQTGSGYVEIIKIR